MKKYKKRRKNRGSHDMLWALTRGQSYIRSARYGKKLRKKSRTLGKSGERKKGKKINY